MTAVEIRHKLDVSRRILAQAPGPNDNLIVHRIICQELRADIPRLERRLRDLGPPDGNERRGA